VDELMACPFCGSAAVKSVRTDEDIWTHNQVEYTNIGCGNDNLECLVEPEISWPSHQEENGVTESERLWNMRKPPIIYATQKGGGSQDD